MFVFVDILTWLICEIVCLDLVVYIYKMERERLCIFSAHSLMLFWFSFFEWLMNRRFNISRFNWIRMRLIIEITKCYQLASNASFQVFYIPVVRYYVTFFFKWLMCTHSNKDIRLFINNRNFFNSFLFYLVMLIIYFLEGNLLSHYV